MASAMDIVHFFKPQERLDRLIYQHAVRGRPGWREDYRLAGTEMGSQEAVLRYEILGIPGQDQTGEVASVGALALTSALFVRALITRRTTHWAGALAAGSVAALGMQDMVKKARSAIRRWSGPGHLGVATVKLSPDEMVCSYGDQEVRVTLAPMKQVILRTFRYQLDPEAPYVVYAVQVDLDDGRFIPTWVWADPLPSRRTGHQFARAFRLPMVFQNVDITGVPNGFSWELGPVLSEPAMN